MALFVTFVLPLIIMIGIFYLMLILPQKREQKRLNDLIDGLKKGDKIITFSGIIATIETINKERGEMTISSEGSKLRIKRDAIRDGFYES